ncbi:MAG TPA: TonB-dependent receptor, partial [Chitinophagaceae bacterium]
PDLEAETSFSYEAGADWLSQKGFKVSATFFQRLHNKLIDYVPTVYGDMPRKENLLPTGNYALAKNVSEVTTTGVETDFQFNRNFSPKSNLWGNIGLVWLNTESSETEASFYISSHAKFLSNFNLHYRLSAFNVSMNGLYKFRNRQEASAIEAKITSDYFVVNTKVEYMFIQNKLGLYIQVDNLFDTDYSDLLGAKMPGRWLMFGASIRL